jgi:hypothetical protein
MPNYTFTNKESGEVTVVEMRIAELDDYIAANPHLEQTPTLPTHVSTIDGLRRPDKGFREILKHVQKTNKGTVVNTFE